eukprot:GHRR01005000.1.p1 GENE.GHRR01005000.1~~GHRR01005000.1.p1  ORF type:complete len:329 (+),score=139.59 GHRR01005000.1:63-989(+)
MQTRANALDTSSLDPRRARRILANRQSAQRSRMKRLQYIHDLENKAAAAVASVKEIKAQLVHMQQQHQTLAETMQARKGQVAGLAQQLSQEQALQAAVQAQIAVLRAHLFWGQQQQQQSHNQQQRWRTVQHQQQQDSVVGALQPSQQLPQQPLQPLVHIKQETYEAPAQQSFCYQPSSLSAQQQYQPQAAVMPTAWQEQQQQPHRRQSSAALHHPMGQFSAVPAGYCSMPPQEAAGEPQPLGPNPAAGVAPYASMTERWSDYDQQRSIGSCPGQPPQQPFDGVLQGQVLQQQPRPPCDHPQLRKTSSM